MASTKQYQQQTCRSFTSGVIPSCLPTSTGSFLRNIPMSKKIPLTQNQFAIVDDEDFEWLNQWKWCADWNSHIQNFYAVRMSKSINGKCHKIYMARKILGLKDDDKHESDHINHITLDNRHVNLRIVTHQQNNFNHKKVKGYYWNKQIGKYQSKIMLNGKSINLGYFKTANEAHNAYLKAKDIYHKL